MSVPNSKSPIVLNVSSTHEGQIVRVRMSSPTIIPTVFHELRYVVPQGFNTTFDAFMMNHKIEAKDVVYKYIHPVNPNVRVIFEQVRIVKTQKPGETKPTYTIHLVPIKDNPALTGSLAKINASDFTEPTFDIVLDVNERTSLFTWGQSVGTVVPIYNDIAIDNYLMPENITNPLTTNQKEAIFSALQIPVLSETMDFHDYTFMGKVKSIKNRGTENEELEVYFNQVIPMKPLPKYEGQVTDLKTAIMASYDPLLGFQPYRIGEIMEDLVKNKRAEQITVDIYMAQIFDLFFGTRPLILMRYFRELPNFKNPKEFNLPLKYKVEGGTTLVLNTTLTSKRFAPIGSGYKPLNNSAVVENAVNMIQQDVNGANPFACMMECANNDKCDLFSLQYNTCKLYNFSENSNNIIGGNYESIMTKDPTDTSENERGYYKNKLEVALYGPGEQNPDLNPYWAWMDRKRVSVEYSKGLQNYLSKDKKFAQYVLDTLNSVEEDQKLRESFVDTHTEVALDSAVESYNTAYKQALENKKSLELSEEAAKVGHNTKIYYNLFTTSLWIINLACLIGILYILIVGFMDFGSNNVVSSNQMGAAPAPAPAPAPSPAAPVYRSQF